MPEPQLFDVDRRGMRAIAMRNGAGFILLELLQNAVDEQVSRVSVVLEPIEGRRGRARLVVEDDCPTGFADLSHAWTLYGASPKRGDATKRGFMDRGEKFVIACCEFARITTTTGSVVFNASGRMLGRKRTPAGTLFDGVVLLTREEVAEALAVARKVIAPEGVTITINGQPLPPRELVAQVPNVSLDTLLPDEERVMRKRQRSTEIRVWRPLPGEVAMLYENGLPVVETGDTFHYDVAQRIPVTEDRNNVPPAFLKSVRVAVLNATAQHVPVEDVTSTWVREARGDRRVSDEAARLVFAKQFGANAVAADPSDPEAAKRAVSEGVSVVHSSTLHRDEWEIARRVGVFPRAGAVFPSARPNLSDSSDARPLRVIPPDQYGPGMRQIVNYAQVMGRALLGKHIEVVVIVEPISQNHIAAWYRPGELTFNVGRLGYRWFEDYDVLKVDALLLHEFGHDGSADHLSEHYHEVLCRLGARWARVLADSPDLGRPQLAAPDTSNTVDPIHNYASAFWDIEIVEAPVPASAR